MTARYPLVLNGTTIQELQSGDSLIGDIPGINPYYKNDIINGQFRVALFGTSFPAATSGAYDIDGWINTNNTSAVITIAQSTGSTANKYSRTSTVTTADTSVTASDVLLHQTAIEGYDCVKYVDNTFVVGFKVKSSVIGKHCFRIYNGTSSYVVEYDINIANTLESKTIVIPGGTPSIASSTNSAGLFLSWANMCGSTYQTSPGSWNTGNLAATSNQVNDVATVGNVFAIENVTLNLGTVPIVDTSTYEEDFLRCQRYNPCWVSDSTYAALPGSTVVLTTTLAYTTLLFYVPARVAPTGIGYSSVDIVRGAGTPTAMALNNAGIAAGTFSITSTGMNIGPVSATYLANIGDRFYFTGCRL